MHRKNRFYLALRAAFFGTFCLVCLCGVARAEQLVILKTRPFIDFDRIQGAALASLPAGTTIKEINLGETSPASAAIAIRESKPTAVLAIGAGAARAAVPALGHARLVVAATPHGMKFPADTVIIPFEPKPKAQVSALRVCAPDIKRLGLIRGKNSDPKRVALLVSAAKGQGFSVVDIPVSSASSLSAALSGAIAGVDAFWSVADLPLASALAVKPLLAASLPHKKPLLTTSSRMTRRGALIAVAPDLSDTGRMAAKAVEAILKGTALPNSLFPQHQVYLNQTIASRFGIGAGLTSGTVAKRMANLRR